MENPSFDDALDWIESRVGKSVYMEVGIDDPTLEDAVFYPVAQHIEPLRIKLGEDTGHDNRGLAVVPFRGVSGRDRLYIDRERITKIILNHAGLRIYFHESIFIAFAGG